MGLEQDVDAGEFTESGYRDGRLEEAAKTPDRYTVLMKKRICTGLGKKFKRSRCRRGTEKGNGNSWSRERFESFGRQARQTWEEAKQDGFGKRAKQAWNDAETGEWGAQAENAWEEVKGRAARSGKDNEKTAQTTAVRKKSSHGILFVISADAVRNSGGGRDPRNRFFICCSDLCRIAWNLRRTVRPGCSSICSSNRRGSIGSGHDRGRHR